MTYAIRRATADDGPELARWPAFSAENVALVAAAEGGPLLGAMTLSHRLVLHRAARVGRVTALVVDEARRGEGVGRALMAEAENALREADCGLLELTNGVDRTAAHAFYEHLGYDRTSVRLSKVVT